jgi:hypothetical protein
MSPPHAKEGTATGIAHASVEHFRGCEQQVRRRSLHTIACEDNLVIIDLKIAL